MKQGIITGISGPVIDVQFPEGSLAGALLAAEAVHQRAVNVSGQAAAGGVVQHRLGAGHELIHRVTGGIRPPLVRPEGRARGKELSLHGAEPHAGQGTAYCRAAAGSL